MNEKQHDMILEETHPSGVEQWYCPSCGRRFLVQWPPAYKMIVIEPGDRDAQHSVSKFNPHTSPPQTEESRLTEELRLAPWLKWFENVDFDSGWGKNV